MPELVQGKTAAELVEAIRRTPNDADPVLIQELSNLRSAEALVGLMEVYDVLGSVYLRREVLRGLSLYDEVAGSEQPALVHLMHCATESKDRELRLEAVAIIGDSHNFGRPYLKRIVDSPADDDVRVEALRLHTANAEAEDRAWYQSLLSPRSPQPTGGRKSKNEEPPKLPHVLGELRLLAFQALAPDMSDEELLRAARDGNMSIREHALRALAASGFPETRALALEVVKNFSEWPQNRAAATAVLGRYADLELVEELIDMAGRRDTPEELILALGDMLAELDEPEIEAYLAK